MKSLARSRLFKRVVQVVYWIALPITLLGAFGALTNSEVGNSKPLLLPALGLLALAALIGWRLWVNSRALDYAGEPMSVSRLFFVILPLGFLAMAGLVVSLLGISWVSIGVWSAFQPHGGLAAFGLGLIGLVTVLAGGGLTLPLFLVLRRRTTKTSSVAPL